MTLVLVAGLFMVVSGEVETPVARARLAESLPAAKAASAAAWPRVLQLFAHPATQKYLRVFDDGSGLWKMSASALASTFFDAVNVAELVHNFGDGVSDSANCGFDLTIALAAESDVFYNLWEQQALGITPVDSVNNEWTEKAETEFFGFPPFGDTSKPDMKTSASRPFYVAVDMYRTSGGNPQCGPVSAILSRSYIDDDILATPLDTGLFMSLCMDGQEVADIGGQAVARCSAWPDGERTLGVPPYLNHMLEPFLLFYNESEPVVGVGEDYPYYNLARLTTRMLTRKTYTDPHKAMQLNFMENGLGYFEMNPIKSIDMVGGIKMLVGMFEVLWGTEEGEQLRQWALDRGWPLAWSFNPSQSYFRCSPVGQEDCIYPDMTAPDDRASIRLLDPSVLPRVPAGHNATVSNETRHAYDVLWKDVDVQSMSHEGVASAWRRTTAALWTEMAVEPLYLGGCSDSECVGVLVNGQSCLCPQS
jgi:hypothetical protein